MYIDPHRMLKKVRPMWDKQVCVIYANDFNLTKTTCITLNTEHIFFLQKNCSKPMYYDGVRFKNIQKKDIHA